MSKLIDIQEEFSLVIFGAIIFLIGFFSVILIFKGELPKKQPIQSKIITYNIQKDSIVNRLINSDAIKANIAIEGNCKTLILQYPNNYTITIQRCDCTEQPQGCWNYFLLHNKEIIPIIPW